MVIDIAEQGIHYENSKCNCKINPCGIKHVMYDMVYLTELDGISRELLTFVPPQTMTDHDPPESCNGRRLKLK